MDWVLFIVMALLAGLAGYSLRDYIGVAGLTIDQENPGDLWDNYTHVCLVAHDWEGLAEVMAGTPVTKFSPDMIPRGVRTARIIDIQVGGRRVFEVLYEK